MYAAEHDAPALREYCALEDDPHGPVELRAVPAAAGHFAPHGGAAVPPTGAVFDMLDADDSCLRYAAREWLEHSAAVTLAELHFGVLVTAEASTRAERLRRLALLERSFAAPPVDERGARSHGRLAAGVVQVGRQPRRGSWTC